VWQKSRYVHQFDAARRSDERRDRLAALYGTTVEAPVEATEGSRPYCLPPLTTRNAPRMDGWMRQKYV
jgi:hypothetical protein